MRHLFLLLILFIITPLAFAQKNLAWEPKNKNPANMPLDEQGGVQFHELVSLPNLSSENILKRARRWAANTYLSTDDKLLPTKRRLVIKGSVKTNTNLLVGHQLVLEASQGQYHVTVDSLHLIYNMNSLSKIFPTKVIRTIRLHPYGVSADDLYEFYKYLYSHGSHHKVDTTQSRRMAITNADTQEAALIDIKQTIEDILTNLKKAIENQADQ